MYKRQPEAGFKIFLDFVGYAPVVGHNVEYDANIVNAQYAVLKDCLLYTSRCV